MKMDEPKKKLGKSWYHPQLTQKESELLLRQRGKKGSFLVRPSKERQGQSTLSVKWEGNDIHHIQLFASEECVSLDPGSTAAEQAASLPELLTHYLEHPIQMMNPKREIRLLQVLNNQDPTSERWFHGYISGQEAEEKLRRFGKRRSFLVRESKSKPGFFVLTVRTSKQREPNKVTHVHINKKKDGYFEVEGTGKTFQLQSLTEIVERFQESSVTVQHTGEVIHVKYPLNTTLITAADVKKRIDELERPPSTSEHKTGFAEEFMNLQNEVAAPSLTKDYSMAAANKQKNRYKNILPYDQTLVPLNDGGQDFINANYIKTDEIDPEMANTTYIATQGPLAHTMTDFWRMVLQVNTRVIVMTTKVVERGKNKCAKYWPDTVNPELEFETDAGLITARYKNEETLTDYVLRTFEVERGGVQRIPKRTIYQYHFIAWPDFGVPKDPGQVLTYLRDFKIRQSDLEKRTKGSIGPVIIHCSAGIGRTGTVIVLDILIQQLVRKGVNGDVDIMDIIRGLRRQREGMIQTEPQYKFLYVAVEHYVGTMIQRMGPDNGQGAQSEYANLYGVMGRR